MATNPETRLTRLIERALKALPGLWLAKIHGSGYQRAGIPDLLVCHEGRFIALEVKTESGVVSPIQEHELRTIWEAGGYSAVVRSVDDALAAVEGAKKLQKKS